MPEQPTAAAQGGAPRLCEGCCLGLMLFVMFVGTVGAFRLGFAAVEANRDRSCAAAIVRAEIEDLRLTPWPIFNDRFLTPAERHLTIAPRTSSGSAGAPKAEPARQFVSTRLIIDPAPLSGDPVRVVFAICWADRSGREQIHSSELTVEARRETTTDGPRLALRR